jgi:hypothetical protein
MRPPKYSGETLGSNTRSRARSNVIHPPLCLMVESPASEVPWPMKLFLLPLLLLLVVPTIGQEHPPTAAQCQADLAVWGDPDLWSEYFGSEAIYTAKGTANQSRVARLEYSELESRADELGSTCTKVDAGQIDRYLHTADFYTLARYSRLYHFVMRHNQFPQFLLEDAQGKR